MEKNLNLALLLHAVTGFWMVAFSFVSFGITLMLLYQHESRDWKRPGINIKEL